MEEYDCYEECNDESDAADETQSESSVAVLDSFSSLKINEDETLKKNTNTKSLETIEEEERVDSLVKGPRQRIQHEKITDYFSINK
jgi:hypothetical protein